MTVSTPDPHVTLVFVFLLVLVVLIGAVLWALFGGK